MPKISIIIPVYNLEEYIEDTLNNVLAQTFTDFEIIAVDDGSRDASPAILDRIAKSEPRLKVIHKENGGVTKARITGIEAATGDYIGFVDGDDKIDPDMFERLYANAQKCDADISHCGYRLVKPTGITYFYNTGEEFMQDNRQGIADLLKGTKIEPGLWNKLFRKELFADLLNGSSVMDFTIKNNEDLLMNYVLFKQARASVFEDFCPYQYIVREESASKGKINEHKLYDPAKAAKIIYGDCDASLKATAAALYVTKLTHAATYYGEGADTIKECRSIAQKELRGFVKTFLSYPVGTKKKLLTLLAAYLPKYYDILHKLYLK